MASHSKPSKEEAVVKLQEGPERGLEKAGGGQPHWQPGLGGGIQIWPHPGLCRPVAGLLDLCQGFHCLRSEQSLGLSGAYPA